MKKSLRFLSLLLSIVMVLGMMPMAAMAADAKGLKNFKKVNTFVNSFTDVKVTNWFYENVKAANELGLMVGRSSTEFGTEGNLTIAETLTIAARLHSIYSTGKAEFVQAYPWYSVYVDYCRENGIADFAGENVDVLATRAEFAQILSNAMPDEAWKVISKIEDNAIPDVKISAKFGKAVYKLYRAGILVGNDSKGTFAPFTNIRRSEVSAIVTRMADTSLRKSIELVVKKSDPGSTPGTPTDPTDPVTPTDPTDPVTPTDPETPLTPAEEYERYCAMTADEQYEYYLTFASAAEFMKWYNAAKAAYDAAHPVIILNPGDVIDLGD